jgi:hypothetical protein
MAEDCPPGKLRNPISSRCVKLTGRKARELYEGGVIDYGAPQQQYRPVERPFDLVAAFAGRRSSSETRRRPRYQEQVAPAPVPYYAAALKPAEPRIDVRAQPCGPTGFGGTRRVRNPKTGRCVTIGGRVFNQIHGVTGPVLVQPSRYPPTAQMIKPRRPSSEGRPDLPLHAPAVAPLADRPTILGWATGNCKEPRDAITGIPFRNMDATALQQLVRLHNRACTLAEPLHTKVAAEHRAGTIATLPDDPTTQMVLADFKVLREAMRRTNPAYKLPARRHQPPPSNWQLYINRDARSGPDYMSVMYVDTLKARMTPTGVEYPPESVRVDIGFIPAKPSAGALCDIELIVETLKRLAESHRLLDPIAGGWKPVVGPYTKAHWTRDAATRLSNFCRQLIRALTTPI